MLKLTKIHQEESHRPENFYCLPLVTIMEARVEDDQNGPADINKIDILHLATCARCGHWLNESYHNWARSLLGRLYCKIHRCPIDDGRLADGYRRIQTLYLKVRRLVTSGQIRQSATKRLEGCAAQHLAGTELFDYVQYRLGEVHPPANIRQIERTLKHCSICKSGAAEIYFFLSQR